ASRTRLYCARSVPVSFKLQINVLEGKRSAYQIGTARPEKSLLYGDRGYSIRKMASVSRFVCEKLRYKPCYFIELATSENTLFALDPMRRMVPTTTASTTASMTAYSAMSCPSSAHNCLKTVAILPRLLVMKGGVFWGVRRRRDRCLTAPVGKYNPEYL